MRPLRSPLVQGVLAWLLARWLRFCFATMRWTEENRPLAEAVWDRTPDGVGAVVMFWHSRISISPRCWPLDRVAGGRAQAPRALISLSQDGEFIARAVDTLGFPAIRGSSTKKSAPDKAKGGSVAFRDGLKWVKAGNGLAVTPDGPRGPAEIMAEGAPLLSRVSKAPALLVGLACRPAIRLNSWDTALVPLPFGRGAIVWAECDWPEAADAPAVAADWTARLNAATRRAEALVA